jgi:hypothetical protein
MPIEFTEYGRTVLTELSRLSFLSLTICGDNDAFNARLSEAHERRKAKTREEGLRLIGAYLQPGQNPDDVISYTGKNGAEENEAYTALLEKFVSESTVCRVIDLYHWYLRRVLQLALSRDRSCIRAWAPTLGLSEKKTVEIETAGSTDQVLSGLLRGREKSFRDLVHQHLDVPNLSAIPLLVEVRNCIVHHLGRDVDGRVSALLPDCPELGIEIQNEHVVVSGSAAYEGACRVLSDISIMDQVLARLLGLPTAADPIEQCHRAYS